MSEDDRAAKAARAKAMLKKRQQKKAADSTSATPGVASPVDLPRTFSPAPSENVEQDARDLGEIFAKDASDTSWLSSLPRAASPPPPRVTTHASLIATARGGLPDSGVSISLRPSSDSEDKSLHDRCKALLKENADLTAEINRLHDFETGKKQKPC
ncbi:hypothetical protein BYT27DRAFT_6597494 [Phlegmacium glaucopus]|nr:hypothetical protein BYT27DRAFT_6597494 [Phlegmacium glaucopus]